jgi:hypothetical protein
MNWVNGVKVREEARSKYAGPLAPHQLRMNLKILQLPNHREKRVY